MPHLKRSTKNLIIRPIELSDFEAYKEFYLTMKPQKNVWDMTPKDKSELTLAKFKKVIQSQKKLRDTDQFYDLTVFEKKTKKMIGRVSAMDVLRGLAQSAYLGYFLHNNFWGRGYGKEAVKAMIDISFKDIKLHRIEICFFCNIVFFKKKESKDEIYRENRASKIR